MKLEDIRVIAKHYQVECDGRSKNELIRKIQLQNGQGNCFATDYDGDCRYVGCRWRKECFNAANNLDDPTERS